MAKKEKESKAIVPVERGAAGLPAWEREFEKLFEDFWRRPFGSLLNLERFMPAEFRMPSVALDVYEEKDDVVVKADMPGLKKEEIEVNLSGNTLTITGERKKSEEVKEKSYYRSERSYGMFRRSVELPADVQADKVTASFKDGVLEIRLPKSEEAKKKERVIKVD
jgi:HSP20 family protein